MKSRNIIVSMLALALAGLASAQTAGGEPAFSLGKDNSIFHAAPKPSAGNAKRAKAPKAKKPRTKKAPKKQAADEGSD